MNDLHSLSMSSLRNLFLSKKISAVEITQYFLNRVDSLDDKIGSFLSIFHTRALDKARLLDEKFARGEQVGLFAAIPFAIKDNIHVKGEITTCASKILENYRTPFDATVTELIEAEDGIIIGKTNLDEFAMGSSCENSALKKTNNPWDFSLVPGGSSGGSAAAVAARLALVSLGSDTGGSVRLPAAYCGVVGFKPTYGRVSRFGLVAFGSSLDQIGPLTTSCEDLGLVQSVLGKHCPNDSTSIDLPADTLADMSKPFQKGTKIGVPWKFLEKLNPESLKNFNDSLEVYKKLGAEIVEVNLDLLHYAIATYYIIATAEVSTNLARFDGIRYGYRSKNAKTLDDVYDLSREEGFGDEVKRRIMIGTFVLASGYQDAYYKKGLKIRQKIIEQFNEQFKKCAFIATPPALSGAFARGSHKDPLSLYLEDIFTVGANLAGIPALSFPSGFDNKGRPLGFQLMAPQMKDADLISMGSAFQKVTDYHTKMPTMVS